MSRNSQFLSNPHQKNYAIIRQVSFQHSTALQTPVDDFIESLPTIQIEFQRTIGVKDTYIPRTVPERLYKRVSKTHESDDLDGAFVLTLKVRAPL
jgi:hypothetical protein